MVANAARRLPFYAQGTVVKGFGRGSKQLGCPTANFANEIVDSFPDDLAFGVYFGFASINGAAAHKMVMSIGTNPHFHNSTKTAEVHILNRFDADFYGSTMTIVVLGYIRPMRSYDCLSDLIKAIHSDISIANVELDKPEYLQHRQSILTYYQQKSKL